MPDSSSFANPFVAPEIVPARACLAWTLRLVIEDPKDPEGVHSQKRAWLDCALSGRAVHDMALALPDWSARARQSKNPALKEKSLPDVKISAFSMALLDLGHDLLGGPVAATRHSAGRICALDRPEHLPAEHFVGRLVVCSAHDSDHSAAVRLALAAKGFSQWAQDFVEPGQWAVLDGEASQLEWDHNYGSNRHQGIHEHRQLRFWKPRGHEAQFAAFFQAGFERAFLLEQTRAPQPSSDEESRRAARAARL